MRTFFRVGNRSKDLLFPSILNHHWRKRLLGKVICLLYHRVDSPGRNDFLSKGGTPVIEQEELDQELRFLRSQGALFLTFADLRRGVFPRNSEFAVIVSFDDCFLDNYTNGLDVLENLGIKGVFFQTAGMINPGTLLWEHLLYWFHRGPESSREFEDFVIRYADTIPGVAGLIGRHQLEYLRECVSPHLLNQLLQSAQEYFSVNAELSRIAERIYPRPEHIQKAHRLGHEIGSHGYNHYKRENINTQLFEQELLLSVDALSEIIGEKPAIFSYPFNSYIDGDEKVCSKYFLQAATVDKDYITRDSNPMYLPRFTWPGKAPNSYRRRRWLLTGTI